jgi:hypothetical protein
MYLSFVCAPFSTDPFAVGVCALHMGECTRAQTKWPLSAMMLVVVVFS